MYAYSHTSAQEATLELDTIIHPGYLNHLLDPARSTLFGRVLPALYDLPSNKGHSVLTNLAVEKKKIALSHKSNRKSEALTVS